MAAVRGFKFSGTSAGIKKKPGALDLGLIMAEEPVPTAAAFTRNLVRASPVVISEQRVLAQGRAQAWLVNSGCANACTGELGQAATLATTQALGEALGIDAQLVLPASTGVIGQVLPTDKVVAALPALLAGLDEANVETFAESILTTDQWTKVASLDVADPSGGGTSCRITAVGKGAGMFHPDLALAGELPQPDGSGFGETDALVGLHATMLVFIVTDAVAAAPTLAQALDRAVDRTFNAASVDGDTSTNDSVYLMASGRSGVSLDADQLSAALHTVCGSLARSMVRDGEGAEHVMELTVRGLASDAEARDIARTVATSPLVKTAMAGQDANWGRLLAAAGRAGVPFDPKHASVFIDGICICRDGLPTGSEADREASARMKNETYQVDLVLGRGSGSFTYLTSDLGHRYVDVNAGYRS